MNEKKYIVITTINQPSEAVHKYSQWKNWEVVIIGDRKSPANWKCEGVTYIDIDHQYSDPKLCSLARALPENSYVRKMLGYAYAIQKGADVIFETDDDNIPYDDSQSVVENHLKLKFDSSGKRLSSDVGWLNIYQRFGSDNCWPRGFPIEFVKNPKVLGRQGADLKPWRVTQFLADEDPDVDAIYRMLKSDPVYFARNRRYLLDTGTHCPFNSQGTLWLPEAFPFLFLPIGVADRVTDILRGYITLACLWKIDFTLAFASPTMYQERNFHNLLNDFEEEVQLYLNADKWSRLLANIRGANAVEYYRSALNLLHQHNVISSECLEVYEVFLSTAGLS